MRRNIGKPTFCNVIQREHLAPDHIFEDISKLKVQKLIKLLIYNSFVSRTHNMLYFLLAKNTYLLKCFNPTHKAKKIKYLN